MVALGLPGVRPKAMLVAGWVPIVACLHIDGSVSVLAGVGGNPVPVATARIIESIADRLVMEERRRSSSRRSSGATSSAAASECGRGRRSTTASAPIPATTCVGTSGPGRHLRLTAGHNQRGWRCWMTAAKRRQVGEVRLDCSNPLGSNLAETKY